MSKITITFPNEGEYEISQNIIKNWDIEITDTIGKTLFCKANGGVFSIDIDEYNKFVDATGTKKIQSKKL